MNMRVFLKKSLAILLGICLIAPYIPSKAEDSSVDLSGTAKAQINTYNTLNGNSGDIASGQFNGQKVKNLMGTEGYSYLYHTKFQSVAETFDAYEDTVNVYMQVQYDGYGSAAEQYFVGLYKTADGWTMKYHRGQNYWPQYAIGEYILSDDQIEEIKNDGLDLFMVNSSITTYTVYVERDGVADEAFSLISPKGNKQIYGIRHKSVDTAASLITTGYFYGMAYTRATVAQSFLNEQDASIIDKTQQEFKNNIGYNANTGNFGSELFDGKAINSIMGTTGYAYLFHTKFQSVATTMTEFDATNNPYMQIEYDGWGSAAEQYFIGLYKGDSGWSLKFHQGTNYWAQNSKGEYLLTNAQVEEITDKGLDIFLVNSNNTTYSVYIENEGVADMAASLVSPKSNQQVYQVKHSSKDTGATLTTSGYFYGSGYTRATAAQDILEMEVTPTINKAESITVSGLANSYQAGELVSFTVPKDLGHLNEVALNGEELTPNGDGVYQFLMTKKYEDSCELNITSLAPTFDYVEHKNGGKIQQVGEGTNNFGNVGNNFLFHTKIKYDGLLEQEGKVQYPETETICAQIQYAGWASSQYSWNSYNIQLVLDSSSVKLVFKGEDNWNTKPIILDNEQIKKLATDGLDVFFVHSANATKVFEMYVEQGTSEAVASQGIQLASNTRGNTTVYQVKQSNLHAGVTAITTGYSYTDYATTLKAAEVFAELTSKNISITYTGEHVNTEGLLKTTRLGDYIAVVPKLDEGYILTSAKYGDVDVVSGMIVSLEHLNDIEIVFNAETGEFTDFVTLTGVATNQHGDQKGRFMFHSVIKSQTPVVNASSPYVEVTYYVWGSNITDNLTMRLYVTGENAGKIQLGKWCTSSNTATKWQQNEYTLDADQMAKVKGDGLNVYLVHSFDDLKHYEVYVENGISTDVVKACALDICHGEHVFKSANTVVGEGAAVTTVGYQYSENLTINTAASALFWSDITANTGNVNDDADVDVRDMVRVMRYAEGVVKSINTRAGDADGDHAITMDDFFAVRSKVLENNFATQLAYYDSLNTKTDSTKVAMNQNLFYNNDMTAGYVGGADPFVMEIKKKADANVGKYIMLITGAAADQIIPVYISSDLVNWSQKGQITIKDENRNTATVAANADIWAMEMIYDEEQDKYFLFFSATPEKQVTDSQIGNVPYVAVGDDYLGDFCLISHEDYQYADGTVLSSKTGSENLGYAEYLKYGLFNPYEIGQALKRYQEQGLVSYSTGKAFEAIDFHPFVDDDGKKYLYFSITGGTQQVVMGMEMEDWTTPLYETLTVLTQSKKDAVSNVKSFDMERNNVNEGPWMTKHNGKYYMTMSINGYSTDNYKVIQAVADSPLGAFRKLSVEEGGIVIGADRIGEVSGPGHHSLIERNGEMYIVYHVHQNPGSPSYSRYIAMDKVEWIKNGNGLEVMYVSGPTKNSLQPLPEFATGYKNVAPLSTITATNVKAGSDLKALQDKVWNSKGSTWKGANSGTNVVFGDNYVKDVEFDGETVITMKFEEPIKARAIMIYNSSNIDKAYDKIEKIEFLEANGKTKYINNLGFDTVNNSYTYAAYQGQTTGSKFYNGASVAEFNEIDVKEIRITLKAGEGKQGLALGEIVVLGKE